jgi:pheromone shutdown protein TraB
MNAKQYKTLIQEAGYTPTPELMKAVEEAHEASATYEMVDTEFKKLASNRKPKQPKV